jgi:putative hemolysin
MMIFQILAFFSAPMFRQEIIKYIRVYYYTMTLFIVSTLTVLIVSFICSMSEATLLSVNTVKLETDRQRGLHYAIILSKLRSNINKPIAAILILNTTANTGGATFAGSAFANIYGNEWMWLYSLIFTLAVLFGTEILPKVVGVTYADSLAKILAQPLTIILKILYPILVVTEFFSNMITRNKKKKTSYSIDDIQTIAQVAQLENIIDTHQEKIIVQTSNLKKRTVQEIMLPMDKLIFIPETIQYDDYFKIAEQHLHTRYPVSKSNSPQDLVGYLNLKEIALQKEDLLKEGLERFVRPLLFVDANMTLTSLLKQFSARHNHLAIVKNDKGENIGMITLEDVVEEVVGEIRDEFDSKEFQ